MLLRPAFRMLLAALSFSLFVFCTSNPPVRIVDAQVTIPARYDGFVYGDGEFCNDTILIEAFFDPICPDSRDAWPHLKRAVIHYTPLVYLIVHPFALPYHDDSFSACRALHIGNMLNSSATYHLLEMFFRQQERFYNKETYNRSKASVVGEITELVVEAAGKSYYHAVKDGFTDRQTDLKTRVSFKYGCSRGVYGTPFFFVNGFQLPNAGSAIDYKGWRSFIDPLIGKQGLQTPRFVEWQR